jgi:hypothetical protein
VVTDFQQFNPEMVKFGIEHVLAINKSSSPERTPRNGWN